MVEMARARPRRRRKHRGTQAGTIRRGGRSRLQAARTGAPSPPARRQSRLDQPPKLRSAVNRAGLAAAVFLGVLVMLLKQPAASSFGLAAFMFLVYIPIGYMTDSFLYRMRQRRKQRNAEE
jgi:hypothetical protein